MRSAAVFNQPLFLAVHANAFADLLLQVPLELYKSSMKGVRKYLVRHVWDGHEESSIVSEARADPNSGNIGETTNRFEHLTCFAGGMFVLGKWAAGHSWEGYMPYLKPSYCNWRSACATGGQQLLQDASSVSCLVARLVVPCAAVQVRCMGSTPRWMRTTLTKPSWVHASAAPATSCTTKRPVAWRLTV